MNIKKFAIIVTAVLAQFGSLFSQGTLPMFWDMDGANAPTGFSADQGPAGSKLVYSSTALVNSAPYALRLDYTTEYAQAYWSGKADTVSFYLAGTSTGNPWQGEVSIDESVDGSTWSTIKTFVDDIPNVTTYYFVRVKSESRYVRIYYKKKVSGYNLAVDDFSVRPKAPSENPEIQVYYKNTQQINQGSVNTGNDTLIVFEIYNNGTKNDLTVSTLSLSGNQAQDFSILTSTPLTVSNGTREEVEIKLTNTQNGTYAATLSIGSNDSDNATFKLDFSTIKGATASEPIAQPSNLNVAAKAFRMNAGFDKSDAEHYLVLASVGNATDVPQDGESYQRGQYIGKSRVIMSDDVNSDIDFDNTVANTTYHIRVFGFNGYGSYTNYLTTNPLEKTVITPGLNPEQYYASVSPMNSSFVQDLYNLINPHTRIYYSNYSSNVISQFEARDTTDSKQIVEGFYTGFQYIYEPPFSHAVMSREHCYPQSYMTKVNENEPNYSDLHLLYTVHQDKANAVRSNYPLDEVDQVSTTFFGGIFGRNIKGEYCYEPRDFAKGTAARANFYACAAYNTAEFPFTLPTSNMLVNELQYQEILKKWNKDFPPNAWEIARHEFISQQSVQGNRNPFVDNPDWACYIDFSLMKHVPDGSACATDSIPGRISNVNTAEIKLFPNPSVSEFSIDLNAFNGEAVQVYVIDYYEHTLIQAETSEKMLHLNADALASGSYLVLVRTKSGKTGVSMFLKP